MSILNELKNLTKSTPNDQDLGAKLRGFLDSHRTCCDDPLNLKDFEDRDSHPYGDTVTGQKCKKCGKLVNIKVS